MVSGVGAVLMHSVDLTRPKAQVCGGNLSRYSASKVAPAGLHSSAATLPGGRRAWYRPSLQSTNWTNDPHAGSQEAAVSRCLSTRLYDILC